MIPMIILFTFYTISIFDDVDEYVFDPAKRKTEESGQDLKYFDQSALQEEVGVVKHTCTACIYRLLCSRWRPLTIYSLQPRTLSRL